MMKNRNQPSRSPAKLAMKKDKLRVVPDDQLAQITGGDAPQKQPAFIGDYY